jgi:hypothetical protein
MKADSYWSYFTDKQGDNSDFMRGGLRFVLFEFRPNLSLHLERSTCLASFALLLEHFMKYVGLAVK